jgi:pyruvate,water dikinase
MTSSEAIKWFADLDKSLIMMAGGKGANLGELCRIGMPVPPGFVVTTAGYCYFVAANRLQEPIMVLAAQVPTKDPAAYEAISAQIRDLFMAGALPADLSDIICTAYAELSACNGPAVAIRSSATTEDLPQASFAGQQETYLNVRGPAALLDAVKECWASLWTARAMAYRERQGIAHEAVAMGVVVQTMVASEISGVLFTANPSSGARDELVINASFGLGEAIVSGATAPDTYVLDRDSMQSKATTLGAKEVMISAADGQRTMTQTVPEARRSELALSAPLLNEVAALGLQVEQHFGGVPQDIEWAVADERCWLLQARPITNLPPPPLRGVRWEPPQPGSIWMRRQIVEHMPEPLSPLFAELYLQEGLGQSLEEMVAFMGDLIDMKIDMWDFIQPPFATTINGYAYSAASFDFRRQLIPALLRLYIVALPKMIRYMLPRWRDEALPSYLARIEHWKGVALTDTSDQELLHGVRELATADAVYWFAAAIPLGLARITDALLDGFLKSAAAGRSPSNGAGPRPTSGPYLRGFPSKTVEAQAQLEAIARQIHDSAALRELVLTTAARRLLDALAQHPDGPAVRDAIQRYLDAYGHQIYNLDFVAPTQADDPLPVLLSLKAAVEHPERDVRVHKAELAQAREALTARTVQSLNPLKRRLFRLLLNWAQRYAPYREEALFYVGAAWPTLRRLALELGRRLTAADTLATPDDVFYLQSAELMSACAARADGSSRPDLAKLVRERRELREARKRLDPPLTVPPGARLKFGPFELAMFEPQPRSTGTGPILNGFAVSPGQVTAAASVIRSPEDFEQMAPDTILVCPTTTPAWTPLFAQAKGLVTDIGGALAHGSIVAREYGIPAVMGTGVATQRIQSGQRIRVDGDNGAVTLLDEVGAELEEATETQPEPQRSGASKKTLLVLAVAALGLAVWWKKRRRR